MPYPCRSPPPSASSTCRTAVVRVGMYLSQIYLRQIQLSRGEIQAPCGGALAHVQRLQERDALHRRRKVLLDEVIFQPAGLRRLEHFDPVDGVVADGERAAGFTGRSTWRRRRSAS